MLSKLLVYTTIVVALSQFAIASGLFIPPKPPMKKSNDSNVNDKKATDDVKSVDSISTDPSSAGQKKVTTPSEKKN
jgi:hypothetical protein